MNYKQVVAHFGGLTKAAQALGVKRQNVHNWGARRKIPAVWQVRLENMSSGKLRADDGAKRQVAELMRQIWQAP